MVSAVTALAGQMTPGQYGESCDCGVIIEEVTDFSLFQLAAWPQTLEQVMVLAAQWASSESAPGPGQMIATDKAGLIRIEPLKWWLLSAASDPASLSVFEPETGCVLDLSHSRTWLRLNGPKAATLLNHFLPIDLRASAALNNSVHSTAFHHVGVTLTINENGFNLFLPRSFAVSLRQLLYDSSLQYGLEVRAARAFKDMI